LPNLQSLHARVETLKLDQPTVGQGFDLIVSRAFASLVDFTSLTRSALRPGSGRWAAMKGRVPDDELAALSADIKVDAVTPIKVPGLAAERCLVWLRPAPN
jgi:16S rRNA (guanine527-N7)-methyltransferase